MSNTPPQHSRKDSRRPPRGRRPHTVVWRHRKPGQRREQQVTAMHEYFTRTVVADRRTRLVDEAEAHRFSGSAAGEVPATVLRAAADVASVPRSPGCPGHRVHPVRRDAQDHCTDDLTFAGRARTHGSAARHHELPTRGPRRVRGCESPVCEYREVESVMAGDGFYSAHSRSQHVADASPTRT